MNITSDSFNVMYIASHSVRIHFVLFERLELLKNHILLLLTCYISSSGVMSQMYNRADANKRNFPMPAKGFLVKVELRKTPDKGVGSFAAEFIAVDTKIAELSRSRYFNEEEAVEYLATLPSQEEKHYWLTHVYSASDEKISEDVYDQLIVNHSTVPNTRMIIKDYNDGYVIALRDIQEGEELTDDYRRFPKLPFLDRLRKENGAEWDFLEL